MHSITNKQLFSAVYLRELQQGKHDLAALDGVRQTIREYRDDTYRDLDSDGARRAYARQCLSILSVASSPRPQEDGFILYADAAKEEATGLCLVVADDDLGRAVKGVHHQARLIRELREASLRWGMLTNGAAWRLCQADCATPYEVCLEADLDALLATPKLGDFPTFRRFFGGEAFAVTEGRTGLDHLLAASDKRTEAVEKHLKGQVEPTLQRLCLGFVEDEAAGSYGPETLQTILQNAIYLLYRVLFLFYAESRNLLPVGQPVYRDASLQALVETARSREAGGLRDTDPFSIWKRLTRLFVVVDDGDGELGVAPYNGGLFSDSEKPYLKSHKIKDDYLAPALVALGYEQTKAGLQPIDYRDLSVRHLGTLYEGLLEYRLNLVEKEPCVVRESNGKRSFIPMSRAGAVKKTEPILEVGQVYFADDKGERKASGSYYTPEDVVQYIVANTVVPKLQERRQALDLVLADVEHERAIAATEDQRRQLELYADQQTVQTVEEGVLALRVIDPAMGSGHFLVAATQRIADFVVETLNLTPWPNPGISTDPLLWKRRVVERCIYGVDKNPLAHELAKLSLWITSASAGKPLTFLDHHLKLGNSLYGTPLSRLANLPSAKKIKDEPLLRLIREQTVATVLKDLADITKTDSDTIETVKRKGEANRSALNALERLRAVADLWLATLFGLKAAGGRAITDEEYASFVRDLTLDYSDEAWKMRFEASPPLQEARRLGEKFQFLHWELAFPDAVVDGECTFDAAVLNPPYVGTSPDAAVSALYQTARCGDLFAWMLEQAVLLTRRTGAMGTVIPASITFSTRLAAARSVLLQQHGILRVATFDNIPDALFNGGKNSDNTNRANSQRASVVCLSAGSSDALRVWMSNFLRWRSDERCALFPSITYADATSFVSAQLFPKVGTPSLVSFWHQLRRSPRTISSLTSAILGEGQWDDGAKFYLVVPRAIRYFMAAVPVKMDRHKALALTFRTREDRDLAMVLLNSNVHYWYWRACGDGFATNAGVVGSFPAPELPAVAVADLAAQIERSLGECLVHKMNSGIAVPNYNLNRRMDILLQIDALIAEHVAPELGLPRDVFAQCKSSSFLRPLDVQTGSGEMPGDDE